MYLEISPRQSGKTSRLVDEVNRHLTKSERKVWIFSPNYNMASNLTKKVNVFCPMPNKFSSKKLMISSANSLQTHSYDMSQYRLFFDEFDFMDDKEFWFSLMTSGAKFNDAYFCTTPKKIRTLKELVKRKTSDPLIKLLRKNKHNYAKYPMIGGDESKRRFFNFATPESYLTEAEGIFVK